MNYWKEGFPPFLVGVFLMLVGFLMVVEIFSGPTAHFVMPNKGTTMSTEGPLKLQFSRRMARLSVENHFSLIDDLSGDAIPGDFVWQAEAVSFLPHAPLNPARDYHLDLAAGAVGLDGNIIKWPLSIQIKVREPRLTFLYPASGRANLWMWSGSVDGGKNVQLTHHELGIMTYDVSRSGESIVYALPNEYQGVDLWIWNEKGQNSKLIGCGTAVCDQPVWAPDGRLIAYSHYSDLSQFSNTPSEIRLVDAVTHEEVQIFQGGNYHEARCTWSLDGLKLACYDHSRGHVRVFNLSNRDEVFLPTHVASSGVWLPDSGGLIISDITYLAGERPQAGLFVANFEDQVVLPFNESDLQAVDIGLPDFSPDGQWLVIGLGFDGETTAKGLWITDPSFEEFIPLTDNPRFMHASYAWHPSGKSIVFQRYDLSTSFAGPEVVLWQQGGCDLPEMCGDERVIAEDAFLPIWLP